MTIWFINGAISIWNTSLGKRLLKLKENAGGAMVVSFSLNGKRLAVFSLGSERIGMWDLASHRDIRTNFKEVVLLDSSFFFVWTSNVPFQFVSLLNPDDGLHDMAKRKLVD